MFNWSNFETFCSRLAIKHRDTGQMVPFRFNPSQRKIMEKVKQHQAKGRHAWVIFLKARRLGISVWSSGLSIAHCLHKPNANAKLVAQLTETGKAMYDQVGEFADQLPMRLPPRTQREMYFPHSGGVSKLSRATAKTVIGGRGLTHSFLHLTEAAFYPGEDSFISLLNTVSAADPDNVVVIETTANGLEGPGEAYYNYWKAAEAEENEFLAIFLPWWEDPSSKLPDSFAADAPADDYEKWLMGEFKCTKGQIAWFRSTLETKCGGSIYKWRQEYPACLLPETMVGTDKGIVPIIEAERGDRSEIGLVTSSGYTGVKECVEIHTKAGRILRGTTDHPIEESCGGFVYLSESLGREIILLPPRMADEGNFWEEDWDEGCGIHSNLTIDHHLARFIGYFMGDGCYHDGTVSIACDKKDQDVVEDVSWLVKKFIGTPHVRTTGSKDGCSEVRSGSMLWGSVMQRLGFYNSTKPHRKVCVPECIFQSPKSVVREFLRGLFEADGCNYPNQNKIVFFSKHMQFLRDVQLLLLGFGITSSISSRKARNGKGYIYDANTLTLQARESLEFNETIGFVGNRKKSLHRKLLPLSRRFKPLTFVDTVISVNPIGMHAVCDLSIDHKKHVFSANGISSHNTPDEAFISSGEPIFDHEELEYMRQSCCDPIALGDIMGPPNEMFFIERRGGPLVLWERPQPLAHYFIGVDAAKGVEEGDFAAIVGWNAETGEQAFRYAGRVGPESLAEKVNYLGRWYNKAMVNVEVTGGWGYIVVKALRDQFHYPNQYLWRSRDDKPDTKPRQALGWETTDRTRQMLFNVFRTAIRNSLPKNYGDGFPVQRREIVVKDIQLYSQCSKAQSDIGFRWRVLKGHDDIAMAAWLGWIANAHYHIPHPDYRTIKSTLDAAEPRLPMTIQDSPETTAQGIIGMTSERHLSRVLNYHKNRIAEDRLKGI